jgi:hypothetical protein
MSIEWADFPGGQKGIYGGTPARMLDGLYAEVSNGINLMPDPDPNVPEGIVVGFNPPGGSFTTLFRRVLSTTVTVCGIACQYWLQNIPVANNRTPYLATWRTTANSFIASVTVDASGRLRVHAGDRNATVVAQTTSPVMLANSWQHIECKLTQGGAGAGAIEIRREGATVLSATGLTFGNPGVDIAQVAIGTQSDGTGAGTYFYIKNLVIWNGLGGQNNNFLGSVKVHDLSPEDDDTLGGWTPSYGTNGHTLLRDSIPFNHLTATGTPNTSNNIRISNTYYRFTTGSVDAGTPAGTSANPWLVNRGSNAEQALSNLRKAINASGTPGTDYSTALTAHPTIEASGLSADRLGVWPKDGTSSVFTFSVSDSNLSWLSTSAMITDGRPDDLTFIAADDTPPAPSQFFMSNLPPDVTSVRGLISIVRARKVDGGDGNLQVSMTPNGTNYALGLDRPMTTAATYWSDISQVSPVTTAPWSPTEVDAVRLRLNRTL